VCRDADVLFSDPGPAFCRSTMGGDYAQIS